MEFLLTIATIVFIFLLLTFALTFSLFLIGWFVFVAVAFWLFIFLRERVRRWVFMKRSNMLIPKPQPPKPKVHQKGDIIDAEFVELPRRKR